MNLNPGKATGGVTALHAPWRTTQSVGPDLSALRALVRPFGEVAYAYTPLSTLGKDARALQWRTVAGQLSASGASAQAVAAIGVRLAAAKEAPAMLATFVAPDGTVRYEQHLPQDAEAERAGSACPAPILPLLTWAQDRPPYVLVVADHAGADITASTGAGNQPRTWTVVGPDDEIERNAPGGWSQPRYQRRAEDSWRHNAGRVAEEVIAAVGQVGAQVLVMSGDVRAVQLLAERLPEDLPVLVSHIKGSRSLDGSQAGRPQQVELVLQDAAATQTGMILDHFQSQLEVSGMSVQGWAATIDALAAGRVAMLLVSQPHDASRTAWFGAGPTEVFGDHGSAVLSGLPVRSAPLADAAVRSALLADAGVRVIAAGTPGEPAEGIGAVCRFGSS